MKTNISLLILFACLMLWACKNTQPEAPVEKSAIESARQEVLAVIEAQNIKESFVFKATEDDGQITTVFNNKAIGKQVTLSNRSENLLLGLYSKKSKGAEKSEVFQVHLVRQDSILRIEVSNMAKEVVEKFERQILVDDGGNPTPPVPGAGPYKSFEECLDDFYCTKFPELQCEANRTCKTIITGVRCCLTDDTCAWFDFIHIYPTDPFCRFRIFEVDIPIFEVTL